MAYDHVDLGFIELPENSWILHRNYFPSKVGGKPAWLHPESLPSSKTMCCSKCLKPLIFLLQLYAPNEERINCFHR